MTRCVICGMLQSARHTDALISGIAGKAELCVFGDLHGTAGAKEIYFNDEKRV
jgi:hypothetical protein